MLDFPYRACVAVCSRGGLRHGTAFPISRDHLVTCTHVLVEAAGRDLVVGDKFTIDGRVDEASLVQFRSTDDGGGDVALLRAPSCIDIPLSFSKRSPLGCHWESYGFPRSYPSGAPLVLGRVGSVVGKGRYALLQNEAGFVLEGGFSGAPVIDVVSTQVLGMIVARVGAIGLMISVRDILSLCSGTNEIGELPDRNVSFGFANGDRVVSLARRNKIEDWIVADLWTLLQQTADTAERHHIYISMGRIGGDRARELLCTDSLREDLQFARLGLEYARQLIHC